MTPSWLGRGGLEHGKRSMCVCLWQAKIRVATHGLLQPSVESSMVLGKVWRKSEIFLALALFAPCPFAPFAPKRLPARPTV